MDVAELLRGAAGRVTTVRATQVLREDQDRALKAHDAYHGEQREEEPGQIQTLPKETRLRLWIDRPGGRLREEGDGRLVVQVGNHWWRWDRDFGSDDNGGDPGHKLDVAEPLRTFLDPAPLLDFLELGTPTEGSFAGRPALFVAATAPAGRGDAYELSQLGLWAQSYELTVDAEKGVLLRAVARFGEAPYRDAGVEEIAFDEDLEPALFEFSEPE